LTTVIGGKMLEGLGHALLQLSIRFAIQALSTVGVEFDQLHMVGKQIVQFFRSMAGPIAIVDLTQIN